MTTLTSAVSPAVHSNDRFLRRVLRLDGAVTAANGAMYLALAPLIQNLLGIPKAAQYPVGAFLIAYGAAVLFVASRPAINKLLVDAFIVVNVAWVVASLAAVIAGTFPTTTLGTVWIVLQSLIVGGFAALQATALLRK